MPLLPLNYIAWEKINNRRLPQDEMVQQRGEKYEKKNRLMVALLADHPLTPSQGGGRD